MLSVLYYIIPFVSLNVNSFFRYGVNLLNIIASLIIPEKLVYYYSRGYIAVDMSNTLIGTRIREIREQRGYTREQLAEYADISTSFLWEIEAGKKGITAQNIGKIAAALDVTTDYLIYGSTPYKENAKINSMIAALPDDLRKQVERIITVFVDALRIGTKNKTDKGSDNET